MTPLVLPREGVLACSAILNVSIEGLAGADSFRKTMVRRAEDARAGREVGNGARGGSGLRSSATETMAVKMLWRCLAYSSLRMQLVGKGRVETKSRRGGGGTDYEVRQRLRPRGLKGESQIPLSGANNKAPRNPRELAGASRACTRDKEHDQSFCFLESRHAMTCSPGELLRSVQRSRCSFFVGNPGSRPLTGGWGRLTLPPLFGGSSWRPESDK